MAYRKAGEFKWTKEHKDPNKYWKYKTERHNIMRLPGVGNGSGLNNEVVYWYDRKVLSVAFVWSTEYEWLDTRRMRLDSGRKANDLLGGGRFLYYVEQPTKRRKNGSTGYVYFQQFTKRMETPPEEDIMKEVFEVLSNSAIEGEECGDYKISRFDAGAAPVARRAETLQKKRRKREELEFED